MKALLAVIVGMLVSAVVFGQTTNTNCTTIGNQTNCTSTSQPDNSESQRQAYQTGQALGAGLGSMVARHNQVKNYCKFHPGEPWHTADYSRAGTCKAPKESRSQSVSALVGAHFVYDSAEARDWCLHEPRGMSYTASDGLEHPCMDVPVGQR